MNEWIDNDPIPPSSRWREIYTANCTKLPVWKPCLYCNGEGCASDTVPWSIYPVQVMCVMCLGAGGAFLPPP